nr:ATP-dependent RNA helicase DBP3 [Rachicladosporium sp. CCFEE 5018]
MAKRLNEEVADPEVARAAKKARKEKKLAAIAKPASPAVAVAIEVDAGAEAKASKEERRAAKKAKNAAANAVDTPAPAEVTTPDDDAAKAARKAARRAEKAAKKASDGTSDHKSENGIAEKTKAKSDASNGGKTMAAANGYTEDPALSALPQSEIDSFLAEKFISVDTNTPLRPITHFKYLPVTDEAQKAPFKTFTSPTPIQAAAWPYMFAGRDVIGVAETGSGKTLAFGVPCVSRLSQQSASERKKIKACMVSPTRELALQIHEELKKLASPYGLKITVVYGGVPKDAQRETLKGSNIIVATPGRLNDYIQEGSIDLSNVEYLVLDEADRMLDKGFEQEIRKIISTTPTTGRQTQMFTATWPPSVRDLAQTFMSNPVKVTIGDNPTGELRANNRITQEIEVMEQHDKQNRLIQLLKQYQSGKNKMDRILVFCLYKKEATRIEEFISRKGFSVGGIHGDLSQSQRTTSLEAFKKGDVPILVATDVAARGLDIPAVKLVINVTFPLTAEDYVHRIGRTGRAGQDGRAITFFTDAEKGLAGALINVLKAAYQPVPEELMKFGTTVKKKGHDAYGAFYKDTDGMKTATKITFD